MLADVRPAGPRTGDAARAAFIHGHTNAASTPAIVTFAGATRASASTH